MAAVILRNVQVNAKSKLYLAAVSGIDKQRNTTTRGELCYSTRSALPPIRPIRPRGQWGDMDPKECWLWHRNKKHVQLRKTAKGKIRLLTEKKFKTWNFPPINPIPNSFEYQCGIAKTHIFNNDLPKVYSSAVIGEKEFDRVESAIVECLEIDNNMNRSKFESTLHKQIYESEHMTLKHLPYEMSRIKVQMLLSNIFGLLGHHEELFDVLIDQDVKVGACFQRHGVSRSPTLRPKGKKQILPNNAPFQGEHIVDFQIRKRLPLTEFTKFGSEDCMKDYPLMYSEFKPKYLGQFASHIDRTITSGFNLDEPGDPYHFTHLSVLFSNKPTLQLINSKYGDDCSEEALKGYALVSGFLSTLAQAHVRGFNMLEELKHSITTQVVLTDGQLFRFCAYQLNTTELWKDDEANKMTNLMWLSRPYQLYEGFENGKVVGFDKETLRVLLACLLLPPRMEGEAKVYPFPPVIRKKVKVIREETEIEFDKQA